MSKRRRNKNNNNSEQGCEVILVDSGARPEVGEVNTSWVDVPDERSEEEKQKDFRINIIKDSEDDYVDAPDETKPDFGVSYDDKMAEILAEDSKESDSVVNENSEQSSEVVGETIASFFVTLGNKLKKVKEVFEPKSDKEPATLGGTILIILLLVVAFIMIVNLCSVMGRLPIQKVETPVDNALEAVAEDLAVEVIDSSKFEAVKGASTKKSDNVSEVGGPSSVVLDETGKPIVNEPASEPVSEPVSEPISEPESEPESEDGVSSENVVLEDSNIVGTEAIAVE